MQRKSKAEYKDKDLDCQAPQLSLYRIFVLFLTFGLRAWGGPIAQISLIQQELVIEQKWITTQRFNRVLSVYQALPGPEATELCCYFGMLAGGRLGSIVAGLGFLLPGFFLMLFSAHFYQKFGIDNKYFRASFVALQATMTAAVFRAVHRISEHALFVSKKVHEQTAEEQELKELDAAERQPLADDSAPAAAAAPAPAPAHSHGHGHDEKEFSWELMFLAVFSALFVVLRVNFFLILGFVGLAYLFWHHRQRLLTVAWLLFGVGCYALYVSQMGMPSGDISLSAGVSDRSTPGLFAEGLLGGLLSFGGAYTAIPFIEQDVVVRGKWMTEQQFLDGLAIGSILPSPLVIFSTFVGFCGGSWIGALVMTIGMFLPAFSFTLIGHDWFERLIHIESVSVFLDAVTAGVTGFIAVTAFQLLKGSVGASGNSALSVAVFILSLASLYKFQHRYAIFVVVTGSAIAGQALFL